MQNFAELHLKQETLAHYGLPDIPYPVPATDLKSALLDNGDLPLAVMLHGLQQRSRDGLSLATHALSRIGSPSPKPWVSHDSTRSGGKSNTGRKSGPRT